MHVVPEALLSCDHEPIRIPGSIQQHGFFLLVDSGLEHVLASSENAERFLEQPLKLILGARLDTILAREILSALQSIHSPHPGGARSKVTYLGSFRIGGDIFSLVAHCVAGNQVLEFEQQDRLVGPEMMNSVITNFVATLERLPQSQDLCNALTEQIAELTGFDRVMLYSFNEEGHGTVLSEVSNGRLPSYLGLRFPASDIPRQARELYILNTTRIIPNADYQPSPLVGASTFQASQLDLSLSVLRSVSPIHLQYMRNMGTAASMSVSIVLEGRFWGLISCHNATPKAVPYLVRSACDMLAKMGATQLLTFQATSALNEMVRFHNAQRDLLTILAGEQNYIAALLSQSRALLKITDAAGVATLVDGEFSGGGIRPDNDSLERLCQWLDEDETREVFASSHLSSVLPWTEAIREVASGLIAVRISSVQRRYVLWFRPEVVSTVRWAGDPLKQQEPDGSLSPRASFNQWKEIVHGRSEPWSSVQVESAGEFRAALTTIGLRRAEEAIELGEARFQQLTQALPVKIFVSDDSGRLTYANDRWIESFLPTGRWFEQLPIHPDDVERTLTLWRDCVLTGRSFESEVRLLAGPGGTERWFYARVIPFQRAGASRAGWIGTLVDLTESKERELVLRMNEKLALTGRMTSVIAHEINNPLEAIGNLMYLIRSELPDAGPATNYIDLVESELERISGITRQTLRWNRESSDIPELFSLSLLADDIVRLFAGKTRNRQLRVAREGDSSLHAWGILGQIRQVLANLFSNAVDASPLNGLIIIRFLERDGFSGVAVEDHGDGMTEAVQARLFEPFFSTKGDLGNGLGLYISHEIVERHNGRIEVRSALASGTTMTVWIPVREDNPSALL